MPNRTGSKPPPNKPAAEVPMTADTLLLAFVVKRQGRWEPEHVPSRRRWLEKKGIVLSDAEFAAVLERARRRFLELPAELFVCRGSSCRASSAYGASAEVFHRFAEGGACRLSLTECQGYCKSAPAATLQVGGRCRVFFVAEEGMPL